MVSSLGQRILIDTNVLIFGLMPETLNADDESPKVLYAHQQSMNAREFLSKCHEELLEVCISGISLSETMEWLPDSDAHDMFKLISQFFTMLPFDADAAFQAGRLAYSLHKMDSQQSEQKSKVRNDLYILATGLQCQCTDFYTTDKVLIKQATRLSIPMIVRPLPSLE